MKIAQLSDLHYTRITWNPFRLFSKRIIGNMNWLLRRKARFAQEQLDPLPQLFHDLQVDLVLLGGDFTSTALHQEYADAQQFTKQLSQDWIAIPGNHDHYTLRSFRNKHFYRYFTNDQKPISNEIQKFRLQDHGVEAHQIAPNWWVIALDTAQATPFYSSKGLFSEQHEKAFHALLRLIPPEDAIICLNHYPFFQCQNPQHSLMRGEVLQEILHSYPQIRLYLHGHTHRHAIADLQPNNLPILLDSGCCVQKNKGTWNLLDLSSDHCTVTGYQWNGNWEPFRTEKIAWTRR